MIKTSETTNEKAMTTGMADMTTDTTEEAVTPLLRSKEDFTLNDRCDGCGAAAQAEVLVSDTLSSLLLCGHHFRRGREMFDARGFIYTTTMGEEDMSLYKPSL